MNLILITLVGDFIFYSSIEALLLCVDDGVCVCVYVRFVSFYMVFTLHYGMVIKTATAMIFLRTIE